MKSHNQNPNEPQTAEMLSPAQELAAAFRTTEAITNPDPTMYRAAGEILEGYFTNAANKSPEELGPEFTENIDSVMSAVGGFYNRDRSTYNKTTKGKIGDHPADIHLLRALKTAAQAQAEAEASNGSSQYASSRETNNILAELQYFENADVTTEVGAHANRPLRLRGADALRDATRSIDKYSGSYPMLADVGVHASRAIIELADIAARHEGDTGNVGKWDTETNQLVNEKGDIPLHKDYLARHMALSLDSIPTES